jgi:ketosteroid isomerase-like protein
MALVAPVAPRRRMSTEQNKAVVALFFDRFSAGDIDGVLATMSEDASWNFPGKKDSLPAAGIYSKQLIGRFFKGMLRQLRAGLDMRVQGCVAEGNKVAVELRSTGELKNGRHYHQEYHMLMEFRDGKICAVREYLDTQHLFNVWIAPPPRPAAGG